MTLPPSNNPTRSVANAVSPGGGAPEDVRAGTPGSHDARAAVGRWRNVHASRARETPADRASRGAKQMDAERIRRVSPEGLPAHPEARSGTLVLLTAAAMMVLLMISVVLAAWEAFWLAATVAALGLVFGLLANPVVWASVLRARERRDADRDAELLD